jgi:hypothetical protein
MEKIIVILAIFIPIIIGVVSLFAYFVKQGLKNEDIIFIVSLASFLLSTFGAFNIRDRLKKSNDPRNFALINLRRLGFILLPIIWASSIYLTISALNYGGIIVIVGFAFVFIGIALFATKAILFLE